MDFFVGRKKNKKIKKIIESESQGPPRNLNHRINRVTSLALVSTSNKKNYVIDRGSKRNLKFTFHQNFKIKKRDLHASTTKIDDNDDNAE
jgi:hypothetical protein